VFTVSVGRQHSDIRGSDSGANEDKVLWGMMPCQFISIFLLKCKPIVSFF
jgi:hypothetical protein